MRHRTSSIVVVGLAVSLAVSAGGPASAAPRSVGEVVAAALAAAPVADVVAQPDLEAGIDRSSKRASIELVGGADVSVTPEDVPNSVSRVRPDGVQVLTVLNRGRTARYRVAVPAGTRLVDTGPGFDVVAAGPQGPVLLARIAAPWAVDATGRRLPTSYALHGDTLVQRVQTRGAVYPVVVDPSVARKWYGWQVRFSAWETKTMALGTGGTAYVASVVPQPLLSRVLAASAGAVSLWAAAAMTYDKCLALNVRYLPPGLNPWYWSCGP